VAIDDEHGIFAADSYLGWVQVLDKEGNHIAYIGEYGGGQGLMRAPSDIVIDKFNRLLVADPKNARIDIYEFVTSAPVSCPGDRDCDGMPDTWEIIYGLNPDDPSDYAKDADYDGLTNLEEFIHGTDPKNPDSDGDGISDLEEIKGNSNPYDNGSLPVADAGIDIITNPALVKLDGTKSYDPNGLPLTYRWVQIEGESVNIKDPDSPSPSFFAYRAGEYKFSLIVNNGRVNSKPDTVTVKVNNVAPVAQVIEKVSGFVKDIIALDGSLSFDSNNDSLIYIWSQVGGETVQLFNQSSSEPFFIPEHAGDYLFSLTVSDGYLTSEPALIRVRVLDPADLPPHAIIAPVPLRIKVGDSVTLDGSFSIDRESSEMDFLWEQVSGPEIPLTDGHAKRISLNPSAPGIYTFKLNVTDSAGQTDFTYVSFIADSNNAHVPHAFAGYDAISKPGEEVCLNGTLSYDEDGDILSYNWRQIEGPRVDINENLEKICFTPVWTGFYKFGLTVSDGTFTSLEDTVNVIVRDEGFLPIEAISLKWGNINEIITLPVEGTDLIKVEQVAGPSVPFALENNSVSFTPRLPGIYVIRLDQTTGGRKIFEQTIITTIESSIFTSPVPVIQNSIMAELNSNYVYIDAGSSFSKSGTPLSFVWSTGSSRFISISAPYTPELPLVPDTGASYNLMLNLYDSSMVGPDTLLTISVADSFSPWVNIKRGVGGSLRYKGAEIFIPPGALLQDSKIAIGILNKFNKAIGGDKNKKIKNAYFIAPEGLNFLKPAKLYFEKNEDGDSIVYISPYGEVEEIDDVHVDRDKLVIDIDKSGVYGVLANGDTEQNGSSDSRCFIASAAFSKNAPEVNILRRFRDKYLLTTGYGRKMVELYYQLSPGIADVIDDSTLLRILTMIILYPVVVFAWFAINPFWFFTLIMAMGFVYLWKKRGMHEVK